MPVRGAKLKAPEERRTRHAPTHDWLEVVDTPFTAAPELPFRPPKSVAEWWADISTMPHCVLWTPADWRFAIETARLLRKLHAGKGTGAEIRAREKIMGVTMDARRDLRIKYVQATDADYDESGEVLEFLKRVK